MSSIGNFEAARALVTQPGSLSRGWTGRCSGSVIAGVRQRSERACVISGCWRQGMERPSIWSTSMSV